MATIVSHAIVAITLGKAAHIQQPAIAWAVLLSVLPDIDVLGLPFGVSHYDFFGHRGFTHSLFFALVAAIVVMGVALRDMPRYRRAWWGTLIFLFACAASHGVLDAMTNGGAGIAFFSPFSNARYFLPWTPLEVSPIGRNFFSEDGVETLLSEAIWLWLPCAAVWLTTITARWLIARRRTAYTD